MTTPEQQTLASTLSAPFAPDQYKSFEGRGGRRFTYVDDEAVMARLDQAFGVEGWSLRVSPINDRCVKVAIEVVGVVREDFGYITNADGDEPFKEAVSDGIRRVGRTFGIARDVYEGKVAPGGGQIAPRAPEAAPAPAQPVQAPVAQPSADVLALVNGGVNPAVAQAAASMNTPQAGDQCPTHPGQVLRGGDKGPDSLYHKQGEFPNGKADWHRPYAAPRR